MRIESNCLLAPLLLIVLSSGCGQMTGWSDSGIPNALDSDGLLLQAGASQEIELRGSGGSASYSPYAVDIDRHFDVSRTSDTPGRLLAAYRAAVRDQIESMGGNIHGTGLSGHETDVRGFAYDYSWRGNEGVVRVHSFVGPDGRIEIILFCYEHRR